MRFIFEEKRRMKKTYAMLINQIKNAYATGNTTEVTVFTDAHIPN